MPSPGRLATPPGAGPVAAERLAAARQAEQSGRAEAAVSALEAAVAAGEREGPSPALADALRQLAVHRHHRNQSADASVLCRRSLAVAQSVNDRVLAAQALNTLGGIHLATGDLGEARVLFLRALALGAPSPTTQARAAQNLGILANIQGELDQAHRWYSRSLDGYRAAGDHLGCAIAYHNLGLLCTDQDRWKAAEGYYQDSLALATRAGDHRLRGLCLVNQAEVDVAHQRYENARQRAEEALGLFDQTGAASLTAGAYRILGMVYRETGRGALAETRLQQAVECSVAAGSILGEAEATQELALLQCGRGNNQEALRLLHAAHQLFQRLDARRDLVHVGGHIAQLEATYRSVVRAWGQSIESADSQTFGHSERVARTAVALAQALRLDAQTQTTILLGAWLHDLGMLRLPHQILAKRGPLTPDERTLVEQHPVWGVELLGDVPFPWDIRSVIRWHHERADGSGYPDRLVGDQIPLTAHVVSIAEAYDALTTPRGGVHVSPDDARAELLRHRSWWAPQVRDAFAALSLADATR